MINFPISFFRKELRNNLTLKPISHRLWGTGEGEEEGYRLGQRRSVAYSGGERILRNCCTESHVYENNLKKTGRVTRIPGNILSKIDHF